LLLGATELLQQPRGRFQTSVLEHLPEPKKSSRGTVAKSLLLTLSASARPVERQADVHGRSSADRAFDLDVPAGRVDSVAEPQSACLPTDRRHGLQRA